jgi:hypothetical protein
MIDEINKAIVAYQAKWRALCATRKNRQFFDGLTPTSVGWKVKATSDFDHAVTELRSLCDEIVLVRMNNRWVAKLILRDNLLAWDVPIIKILQLRPGSSDATGMDHIDFYSQLAEPEVEKMLAAEDIHWSHEANRPDYTWASIWFDGTEAKIKNYTIVDIYTRQLDIISQRIKGE